MDTGQPIEGLSTIDEAIAALKNGRIIIVIDDEERENEGDFVCAAESITPEMVTFMLRYGAGVLCVPLTKEAADRQGLVPIVDSSQNDAPNHTLFLTPVDHRHAGSGVSSENRAMTIRAMADPKSSRHDFVRPGHINPLLAKEGGVLRRSGHTEATVDLMKIAGLEPVGVLIEILSESGQGMAALPELRQLAVRHSMPIISIEQLIRYRRLREQLVSREAEVPLNTREYGQFKVIAYRVEHDDQQPLALVWGDLASATNPLVRVHSSCFTGDVLDSLRCDCGDQLHLAMRMINSAGAGAVIYLPQEGRGIGLTAKLKAYMLQDEGYDTVEANHKLGFKSDSRDYMIGLQILKDLGLSSIRLLTNNPKKMQAFPAFDLDVVEQVPIIAPDDENRRHYMATKRDKMGHLLPAEIVVQSSPHENPPH
ncbi:bifunctional 3,4-dihydroxy-2-butanone-4-phosphate synthase/GTP cyclohydrolase II [Planctopirus hydrillae]|uniref:GTP cyclohydrolase-2 n=1 Tax=Planctopirus hydrillae TaxID=1841610 RepID=A0A1C3E443_9PLAN|nr:bifunctional 3,4-dihydroxy-2-butanone-4-phosphate synthase/GTP cyclohydrolase II [Planctopirus hydrillae]ODA27929.1 bifunctional 3,4-dihydroxy-2-butanone 4-phosphate synthase/GTP cyclohydrolase II [Planctopirus hydrillae]